jgi:hypothetical protein
MLSPAQLGALQAVSVRVYRLPSQKALSVLARLKSADRELQLSDAFLRKVSGPGKHSHHESHRAGVHSSLQDDHFGAEDYVGGGYADGDADVLMALAHSMDSKFDVTASAEGSGSDMLA